MNQRGQRLTAWFGAGLVALFMGLCFQAVSLDATTQAAQKGKKKGKDKGKKKVEPPKKKELPKDKTPPLFELKGHKHWVQSIDVSANGQYAVTASRGRDGTIMVWDLAAKKALHTLKDYKRDVKRLAVISPDGTRVASCTWKVTVEKKTVKKVTTTTRKFHGEIKLWDLKSGKEVKSLAGHSGFIQSLAFSPNGQMLVSGSEDETAIIWDVKTGKVLQTLKGHKGTVLDAVFSRDNTQVATAGTDKLVKIFDVKTGNEVKTFKGPGRDVTSVVFGPDGKHVTAGSLDENIYTWNIASGKETQKLKAPQSILSVAYSPAGKYLAATGYDDTTKVWDAKTGKELFYRNGHKYSVLDVAFTPDNNRMITVGMDQTIKVWEVPKK